MTVKVLIQLSLAMFGLTAMFLALGTNLRGRKWAPIIGLMGQPAWLLFAWQTQAGGLALLSVAYSAVYVRGILIQWRKPAAHKEPVPA